MRTGATAGSEGRTACLQLTRTTEHAGSHTEFIDQPAGIFFEVVSLGSALDSCSNAAARANICEIYCKCSN